MFKEDFHVAKQVVVAVPPHEGSDTVAPGCSAHSLLGGLAVSLRQLTHPYLTSAEKVLYTE